MGLPFGIEFFQSPWYAVRDLQCLKLGSECLGNGSKWSIPARTHQKAVDSTFSGDHDLVKAERDALEQQRRNLQEERAEFLRQVTIEQNQIAQQKGELNAGQTALQHAQQAFELTKQDLTNQVEQQRRENNALREDLHRRQEALHKEHADMVRKEKARRLRR